MNERESRKNWERHSYRKDSKRERVRSRSRSRGRDIRTSKLKKKLNRDDRQRSPSSSYSSRSRSRSISSNDGQRKYSSRRSSSSDSASSINSLEKLKLRQKKLKEEKTKKKEQIKSTESVEEKRLRRLGKKEAKERKRKERMGWDEEYMGYTNTDNPFGDAALHKTFVWKKKLEKDGVVGVSNSELEHMSKIKQKENKDELEKVKKRRLERERERQAKDDEMQKVQRDKEAAQFEEWEKQEDTFHLKQARLRSRIRIDDGRAKPIDLLAKYVGAEEEEDLAVEMHEPYTYLTGLAISDLEDLLEDIKVYMEIESSENMDFWKDMIVIVEDEMQKLRRLDAAAASERAVGDRRDGINNAVTKDVESIFKGKTYNQLIALHNQIDTKVNSGAEGVDVGYWESLLSQLDAHMAKARLRDRHQHNLRKKLFQLKQEQGVENPPVVFPIAVTEEPAELHPEDAGASTSAKVKTEEQIEEDQILITEDDLDEQSESEYLKGSYTPVRISQDELEPGTIITNPEEDEKRLDFARQQLVKTGAVETGISQEEKAFEREARKGMDDEEATFSVEAALDQKTYLWSDKYRPRKPRYFNRVHTGFEWNKYNQTHYDMDNPPPKIVQGYKFNIFYPDLIDKNFTPEYYLKPCPGDKDFATLRFHAGPPYEDIAFKIVNREWEFSYKKGFRCQFHNNIFQLWFHFKRYRYRR